MSRTFESDPFMSSIYEHWIRGKHSIVALTDNSKVIQTQFTAFVTLDTDGIGAIVHNMGWAKHRHESMVKPLSRSVLNICAQMRLGAWIANSRRGRDESKHATAWLQWLCEEKYIQACMMADAGDETMMLLRYTDNEQMQVEKATEQILTMRKHVCFLFGPDAGCTKVPGYTSLGLEIMGKPRYVTVNGKLISLGGPGKVTEVMIQRCLCRMAGWLVVLDSVISTEFPSLDTFLAFSAFDLEGLRCVGTLANETKEHLRRLALVFKVETPALLSQFEYLQPIADGIFKATACCNMSAWVRAFSRAMAVVRPKPMAQLRKVLIEWNAYVATTAAVEQGFAKSRWAISAQQGKTAEDRENTLCKLVMDRRKEEEAAVMQRARELWALTYGECRGTPKLSKITKGIHKAPKDDPTKKSEAAWLRQRRAAVKTAAASTTPDIRAIKRKLDEDNTLGQGVKDELAFQRKKQLKREIEALGKGVLFESEITDELKDAAIVQAAKTKKSDHNVLQKNAKQKDMTKDGTAMSAAVLQGRKVYLDGDLDTDELRKSMARAGLIRVTARILAEVFAVADPTNLSNRIHWVAALSGGYVSVPSLLVGRAGATGVAISFKAALSRKCKVWVSPRFKQNHDTLFDIIRYLIENWQGSRWEMVNSDDPGVFRNLSRQARCKQNVLALVTKQESEESRV